MHDVLIVLAVIAVVAFVIVRQLKGEPIRGKRLIVLPAVLALIGIVDLTNAGRHPAAIDIFFISVSALIAAGIGVGQGLMMHLEPRLGALWGKMPVRSLWLWAALIATRVGLDVIASAAHAHVAASTASILLVLGVNRLAQAAVITARALSAGIPFAPEKDGRGLLSGSSGGSGDSGDSGASGASGARRPPIWTSPDSASPAWTPTDSAPPASAWPTGSPSTVVPPSAATPRDAERPGPGPSTDWASLGRMLASTAAEYGGRRRDERLARRIERHGRRR